MSPENIVFDRSNTARMIAKPLSVARRLNLPLYCGEWGCLEHAPMDSRIRWYQDVCAVLADNQIGWATWDYQGGFGLVKDGQPVMPVIRALGLKV
jgi:endoglucanase